VPTAAPFHHIARAIAFGQAGNTEQAAAALAQLTTVAPNNANIPLVTALLALRARDLPAAETALAQAGPANLLAQSLRADVMLRKGQRREALALRDQVLASAIKLDGNPGVDFFKVVARLHAQQLR
jgi:predicted Zn-dependent protease